LPAGIVRLQRFGRAEHVAVAAAGVILLALPLVGDAYAIKVAIEVLAFALAAFSLNFLIGVGGIVSFGHAAYFGLGAYAAGLMVTRLGLPRRGIYAPFGYPLRAARDSAVRADAIGIDVRAHRWLAFIVAGAAAGLAGGLFAFSKGSIDPTLISISMSVDFLVMTLLGGVQTVVGPLIGAAAFHSIRDLLMPLTDYWRLLLGLAIIGPNGAGKSTIFNMVGGQLRPDSGRVMLADQDITGLAPRRIWRLGVGRTFQVAQTFVSMTVAENVQMALISRHGRTRAWW